MRASILFVCFNELQLINAEGIIESKCHHFAIPNEIKESEQ